MKSIRNPICVAVLAGLTTACGGGGGGSGGTSDGTSVTSGAITAFGSIVVNGRHLEVGGPSVTIRQDDDDLGEAELELGEFVRVRDDDDGREVEVEEAVVGPVDTISGSTLTVMGQTVLTDAATVFDDSPASDPGSLAQGDIVEVHGLRDDNGAVSASRVERKLNADEFKVTGTVRNHQPASSTFEIDGLTIDYGSASEIDDDLPGGNGSWNDLLVEVEAPFGNYMPGPPKTLQAAEVDREDPVGAAGGQLVEIERIVTEVNGDTITVSGGLVVDISGAEFKLGTAAELLVGVRVEIEGRLQSDGTLVAREIKFDDNDVRLSGRVSGVDVAAGTFELLGVTVGLASNVEFDGDDSSLNGLSDLNPNDFVEVEGRLGPNGNVIAHEIEREDDADADEDLELRGPVSQIDAAAGTLTILGVPITIGDGTELEIDDTVLSRTAFFNRLVLDSTIVEVRWDGSTFTGTDDIPEKAEIEHEEDDDDNDDDNNDDDNNDDDNNDDDNNNNDDDD